MARKSWVGDDSDCEKDSTEAEEAVTERAICRIEGIQFCWESDKLKEQKQVFYH